MASICLLFWPDNRNWIDLAPLQQIRGIRLMRRVLHQRKAAASVTQGNLRSHLKHGHGAAVLLVAVRDVDATRPDQKGLYPPTAK